MTNFKTRFTTAIATGAVLVQSLAPVAFAETTITISGNARNTNNDAVVNMTNTTTVTQSNNAVINNDVDANANSGGNRANDNRGDVSVHTGEATTVVELDNKANQNHASVDCCKTGDMKVNISGNARDSQNTLNLDVDKTQTITQDNTADIDNNVDADSNSGDNTANDNMGGDVEIRTGKSGTRVTANTAVNLNSAVVGGDSSDGGDLSVVIAGNGRGSDNDLDLDLSSATVLTQDNVADVNNDVDANSNSGDNRANDNLGGEVMIHTGQATTIVEIDNMANFNAADVACDCLLSGDLKVSVADNARDSDNTLNADLIATNTVTQDNDADLENDLVGRDGASATSGDNVANDNMGEGDTDPSIHTDKATTSVTAENTANLNSVGDGDFDMPEFEFDFNMNFMSAFMSWMSSHN